MTLPPRLPQKRDDAYCKSGECSPPLSAPVHPYPVPPPPPASSPGSHGRATFVTALIIAGAVLAFLIVCLFLFLFVRRRREQRRRREALLEAALVLAAPTPDGGGGMDLAEEAGGGEEIVHHAWLIRTVGLDEAAIESIALTRYRAGAGGASDCAVCLGEFADGELLRLLPRCAHAFHVRCIDTWLRAHVNCPLCRSHVLLDPAPIAADQSTDAAPGAGQVASSISTAEMDQQTSEQRELRLQIDEDDDRTNSPEPPRRHSGPRVRDFRRVASMDSPSPIASAEEAPAPEPDPDEEAGGEKQGTGRSDDHCELSSPGCSGRVENHRGVKRSLSVGSRWALVSRHRRRSTSLLPL